MIDGDANGDERDDRGRFAPGNKFATERAVRSIRRDQAEIDELLATGDLTRARRLFQDVGRRLSDLEQRMGLR